MKSYVLAIGLLFLAGCATSRTVTEKQPMTGQFSKYSSLRIEYQATDVEGALAYYNHFAATLKKDLDEGHMFKTVSTTKGATAQLVATCKITKVDRPSQAMTLLTKGSQNSTVNVEIAFNDTTTKRAVSSLDVMGNSANRSRSSVGGISLTSSNDLTLTALEEAAKAVTGYVQKNMTEASKVAQQ